MLMEIKEQFYTVTKPETYAQALQSIFAEQHPFDQDKEQFFCIGMNTQNVIRYVDLVSMGTLNASLVHPREAFRHAVAFGVSCVAFAHNHPSGSVTESREDIAVTLKMIKAGKTLGIEILDHVVFSTRSDDFTSLRESDHYLPW